jgi:lycopene beta-cyclase
VRALDADLLIAGAGCAGLSLACALIDEGFDRRVLLIDPRELYERDRTFCFWSFGDPPFASAISHRWPRWRVREGDWIERSAPGIEYVHIPADAFYREARAKIARAANIEIRLGVRGGSIEDAGDHASIETDAGTLHARAIFDSRPPRARAISDPGRDVSLIQHFEGWHVRADRARFDPELATLMDFGVPQDHGVHFFYVLPYSAREALVEATFFGTRLLADADYARAIERYLERELDLREVKPLHRERGAIPMSSERAPMRASARVYRIGVLGGLAKPSTGYAFAAIQRFSRAMASRLVREELPDPPEPRPWRATALDRIFLSYLARHPDRAPAALTSLFARADPALVARFMSDLASPSDHARVMGAMPIAGLGLETLRAARLWLR